MLPILDHKLAVAIEEQVQKRFPDRVKRCMRCGKPLRKQNRSYLCSTHYRLYKRQTERIHRLIKKFKEDQKKYA
jgi:hypothetical protein